MCLSFASVAQPSTDGKIFRKKKITGAVSTRGLLPAISVKAAQTDHCLRGFYSGPGSQVYGGIEQALCRPLLPSHGLGRPCAGAEGQPYTNAGEIFSTNEEKAQHS